MTKSKIAVLVLNYNGAKFLAPLFKRLDFLRDAGNVKVVLIDNASADKSYEICSKQFPWVKYIRNVSNFGWGGGYNEGIKTLTESESFTHYLFLNNDTEPSEEWFRAIQKAAENDADDIAEWGCRTVFADEIVIEEIFKKVAKPLEIFSLSKSKHEKIQNLNQKVQVQHSLDGHTPLHISELVSNFNRGYALQIHNPYPHSIKIFTSEKLRLAEKKSFKNNRVFELNELNGELVNFTIKSHERIIVLRSFPSDFVAPKVLQNNGIGINDIFEGFDLQYYRMLEDDFDQSHLRGICGVSKMVRSDVFHKLNGFDDAFFMYYEDLDFSLRLQKLGYGIKVIQEAILGHHHGGSSDTQSLFFARQVAWSRLYFQWKHAPILRKLRTLLGVGLRAREELGKDIYESEKINTLAIEKFKQNFPNSNFFVQKICKMAGV